MPSSIGRIVDDEAVGLINVIDRWSRLQTELRLLFLYGPKEACTSSVPFGCTPV